MDKVDIMLKEARLTAALLEIEAFMASKPSRAERIDAAHLLIRTLQTTLSDLKSKRDKSTTWLDRWVSFWFGKTPNKNSPDLGVEEDIE